MYLQQHHFPVTISAVATMSSSPDESSICALTKMSSLTGGALITSSSSSLMKIHQNQNLNQTLHHQTRNQNPTYCVLDVLDVLFSSRIFDVVIVLLLFLLFCVDVVMLLLLFLMCLMHCGQDHSVIVVLAKTTLLLLFLMCLMCCSHFFNIVVVVALSFLLFC